MTPSSVLAAVSVLAVVIFVHELGHFLVAKWCDVEVKTFSMGFGPTLFSKTVGETEYRAALIPLGGYIRMAGTDDDEESEAPLDPERGFTAKSIPQRAAIIAAGPAVNFVFAMAVYTGIAFSYGVPSLSDEPLVGGLQQGGPADVAGLKAGDRIAEIDGVSIPTWDALLSPITASEGRALALTVEDETGARREVTVTPEVRPRHDEFGEVVSNSYMIGIARSHSSQPVGALASVQFGAQATWRYSMLILETLSRLVQGRLDAQDLGGPIMIAQEASRQAKNGLEPLLAFLALISVNLGIINILPIPVLDGGHLAFLSAEAVRGRPLSLRFRENALSFGMLVLGGLMIFVVCNDIWRIAAG